MASEAQIAANRRNATRSTGQTTDAGKRRVRENALKHGVSALTIVPFSLHGDPGQLEERTAEWDNDVQPRNVVERNLVRDAARLTLEIERGQLIETQMIGASQSSHIRELGSRLLNNWRSTRSSRPAGTPSGPTARRSRAARGSS